MTRISKEQLLLELEQKVENQLQLAIHTFQNLDEETLLKPAANGGWSIAQCLEHLNRYGRFYLPEIEKALTRNKQSANSDWFESGWLGNQFIKMLDPSTGKKKMRTFKDYNPAPNLDAQAIVAEFITQQERLLMLLNTCRQVDLNANRIPISISRWVKLKLGDVLQFLIAHNERHLLQAKRNLA